LLSLVRIVGLFGKKDELKIFGRKMLWPDGCAVRYLLGGAEVKQTRVKISYKPAGIENRYS
jgi:hypothetical protein